MARKPRIEFPGAVYHVISRGNYRKDLFSTEGAAKAFEDSMVEACTRCGWRLHAYVLMSNHYHLALETPEGNLTDGMRWLQGTYGNRFNRFRGERGHVFQGRYKALLVEEGQPLLGLINYIHLNPVRAGLCGVAELREYPWSSFPKCFQRKLPAHLVRERFLGSCGFPDSRSGMQRYQEYLAVCEEADPQVTDELRRKYIRGWIVASKEYKRQMQERFAEMGEADDWGGSELREMREARYEAIVREELVRLGKSESAIATDRKGADWKVAIAARLRRETPATNPWIARRLNMGHPTRVSNLLAEHRKNRGHRVQ